MFRKPKKSIRAQRKIQNSDDEEEKLGGQNEEGKTSVDDEKMSFESVK